MNNDFQSHLLYPGDALEKWAERHRWLAVGILGTAVCIVLGALAWAYGVGT